MPIYQDIIDFIQGNIRTGVFPKGSLLPTENELCKMFSTSRMTVRKALDILANKGEIHRIKGKGSFVPAFDTVRNYALAGFSGTMKDKGVDFACEVLCLEARAANENIAEALRIEVGAPVWYLERVHTIEGKPVNIEFLYYNAAMLPGFLSHDFATESVFTTLREKYRRRPYMIHIKVSTKELDGRYANILFGEPKGTAMLIVTVAFDVNGIPVEYSTTYGNGSRYELDVIVNE